MKIFFLVICTLFSVLNLSAQQTIVQYLSGTDKDHTVKWDFMCTSGRNSNKWSTIPMPSCWEMQGFGTYNYYQDKENPDEQGLYKYSFKVTQNHRRKKVVLVFDASMTDTEVKINGSSAGAIHQGSFYQFKYDITSLISFDKANLLEVKVSKKSANASINKAERKADFWLFGGIFRPVYLEILPTTFIERIAIDAKANGDFKMEVFSNASATQVISAQVFDLKNNAIGKPFQVLANDTLLHYHFTNIKQWNPEEPALYNVVVSIKESGEIIHSIKQRFGFRTAELRPKDGFYVNGKKVIFKEFVATESGPKQGEP